MSVDQAGPPAVDAALAEGRERPAAEARVHRARRRQRRVRRRRWPYVTGAVAAVVAVGWVGWVSPATLVDHVVVDSPPGISEKAVRKASGVAATDHVPAVDTGLVRRNVLAALPAVAAVDVRRRLPDTVALVVTARTPFAAVPRGGRYIVIDASGVEFDDLARPGRLPVIEALSYEGGQSTRAVLASLPADLVADVRAVTARTHHDVTLTLADGVTVRWGSPDQPALKAQVLDGLRSVKARYYDVSAPLVPTTSG